ncbi:MAG: Gfo/Idh/MocA family oxidoreductase, partial [Planctomycetota bacterium]
MATKIGIIGAGGMLDYHAKGFQQAGAEIVAITDMNEASAAKAAEQWKAPNIFTDPAEMVEKADIDAVSIIVPNKFHAPLSLQCLKAGKHVFCEKPPAINATEVEEMIAAASSADKKLMFNFNNRARLEEDDDGMSAEEQRMESVSAKLEELERDASVRCLLSALVD